jgi:hypothetical protein
MIPKSGYRFSEKITLQRPAAFACVVAVDAYIEGLGLYDIPDTP